MDDTAATSSALEIPAGLPLEEVQRIAFGLWCDKYSKSCVRVSRAVGVSERTVFRWQSDQHWEERRRELFAVILPGLRLETAIPLALASYKAAKRLNQLMDIAEHGGDFNPKEVQALTLVIDRAGFAPVRQSDSSEVGNILGQAATKPDHDRPARLTDSERRRIAAKLAASLAPAPASPADDD